MLSAKPARNMAAVNDLIIQKDKTGIAEDAVSIVVPDATVYLPLEESDRF